MCKSYFHCPCGTVTEYKRGDGEPQCSRTEPFEVGQTYKTQGGQSVTIISVTTLPGYECAQGDDGYDPSGGFRYNRPSDRGRVTGSAFDMSDPRNLIPKRCELVGGQLDTNPEPCFECGSTDRIGTACKPCNPEITDPNFGYKQTKRYVPKGVTVIEAGDKIINLTGRNFIDSGSYTIDLEPKLGD